MELVLSPETSRAEPQSTRNNPPNAAAAEIQTASPAPGSPGPAWQLVWSDEFNHDGKPDPAKWIFEKGMIRNREKQYYTDRLKNARVEDGKLIIEAHEETMGDGEFTSASLITRGKADWTHGRIEVRARLPHGHGVWPAIWMLGVDEERRGWPARGEIDIMEHVGYEPGTIHANIHTRKYNHVRGTNKGDSIQVEVPHEQFHIYAVEWFPDRMDFYVNEEKYFSYENEGTGWEAWPFDNPHYLILNLAIGGTWGGQQGIDRSVFPQRMEVDYVRVYQQK